MKIWGDVSQKKSPLFVAIKSEYLRRFQPAQQIFRRNEPLGAPEDPVLLKTIDANKLGSCYYKILKEYLKFQNCTPRVYVDSTVR